MAPAILGSACSWRTRSSTARMRAEFFWSSVRVSNSWKVTGGLGEAGAAAAGAVEDLGDWAREAGAEREKVRRTSARGARSLRVRVWAAVERGMFCSAGEANIMLREAGCEIRDANVPG